MTSLNIRPILSALLRNRTGAVLVAVQIAIALAVLVNAVYIVKQRVDHVTRSTGIDEDNIFVVNGSGFTGDYDHVASVREDLAWLREQPGVIAATPINAVPLSGSGSANAVTAVPNDTANVRPVNVFEVDHQGMEALGLRLIAGRPFAETEILPPTIGSEHLPQMIVTRALAEAVFPGEGERAVGRTIYDFLGRPITITGIVEHMHGSWVHWPTIGQVALVPRLPSGPSVFYLVRTAAGQRDGLLAKAEAHLSTSNPGRVVSSVRPFAQYKQRSYLADRNMAIFLVAVTVLMFGITGLGIFGLATFNVSTRTRQIGTRRAVGARRGDIVRYFLVENWLVTTAGVVLGCAAALAVGYQLSLRYELPRLDLYYLVGGVLVVWGLGQLAAWQPARRAAAISPSVATRTV
jgi:putative ABC transport system permease protein